MCCQKLPTHLRSSLVMDYVKKTFNTVNKRLTLSTEKSLSSNIFFFVWRADFFVLWFKMFQQKKWKVLLYFFKQRTFLYMRPKKDKNRKNVFVLPSVNKTEKSGNFWGFSTKQTSLLLNFKGFFLVKECWIVFFF